MAANTREGGQRAELSAWQKELKDSESGGEREEQHTKDEIRCWQLRPGVCDVPLAESIAVSGTVGSRCSRQVASALTCCAASASRRETSAAAVPFTAPGAGTLGQRLVAVARGACDCLACRDCSVGQEEPAKLLSSMGTRLGLRSGCACADGATDGWAVGAAVRAIGRG